MSSFLHVGSFINNTASTNANVTVASNLNLTFVHIPKNAGTAIEEAGAASQVWWPRKWLSFWHGLQMPDNSNSSCEKYHVPPQYLEQLNDSDSSVFDNEGTFCVTRHPYERAVSEYLYMLSVPWGAGMSDMFHTGLHDKPDCSVEGLNHFLQSSILAIKNGSEFLHDCHMVPQVEFVWGKDGRQWCKHILRSDGLPDNFNDLMRDHGYSVHLEKKVRSNNSTKTCPDITVDSLSSETLDLLNEVYSEDFERLGYNKRSGMSTPKATPPVASTPNSDVALASVAEGAKVNLTFVHIPTNDGEAIEEAGAAEHLWWPRKWLSFWHGVQMPDGNSCEKYHVPPQYLEQLNDSDSAVFAKEGTFCVTSHPYERAVSEYLYMLDAPWGARMSEHFHTGLHEKPACSAEGLNHFLRLALNAVKNGTKFLHDCHMVPQADFIWGRDGRQWCKHILRSDRLPGAFNDLMRDHGYAARLDDGFRNSNGTTSCALTPASLSRETMELLDSVYEDDFAKLGYNNALPDGPAKLVDTTPAALLELSGDDRRLRLQSQRAARLRGGAHL